MVKKDLSVVVPTYNERENVKELTERIQKEFKRRKIRGEIIFVDDDSPDGTGDVLDSIATRGDNVKVLHRRGKLGLSSAVIEGWKLSSGEVVGVMDSDLSHPPEKVGDLYREVKNGAEIAIGSRYTNGGKIVGWKFHRLVFSKSATLLARPITKAKDPMSGFFFLRRDKLDFDKLNSKGFKILLEVLFKLNLTKIKEVPITFSDRKLGKSKASAKEFFLYAMNLKQYYLKKFKKIIRFAVVGFVGTILNLLILYSLTEFLKLHYLVSAIIAFFIAATHNYIFNKVWTFEEVIHHRFKTKYVKFILVSILSLVINLLILYGLTDMLHIYYIISQLIAILAGLALNYVLNLKWTFKK